MAPEVRISAANCGVMPNLDRASRIYEVVAHEINVVAYTQNGSKRFVIKRRPEDFVKVRNIGVASNFKVAKAAHDIKMSNACVIADFHFLTVDITESDLDILTDLPAQYATIDDPFETLRQQDT